MIAYVPNGCNPVKNIQVHITKVFGLIPITNSKYQKHFEIQLIIDVCFTLWNFMINTGVHKYRYIQRDLNRNPNRTRLLVYGESTSPSTFLSPVDIGPTWTQFIDLQDSVNHHSSSHNP